MAWSGTNNSIFAAFIAAPCLKLGATGYGGLVADTINTALYNNTTTPDRTVAVGSTGYNTGQWVTGNEVTGGSDWVAGGRAVPATKTCTAAAAVTTFSTTTNLTSAATATITAYGCLLYDNTITAGTVAKQGVCFLDFGGVQTCTSGTFSLNWNASGIFTITVN